MVKQSNTILWDWKGQQSLCDYDLKFLFILFLWVPQTLQHNMRCEFYMPFAWTDQRLTHSSNSSILFSFSHYNFIFSLSLSRKNKKTLLCPWFSPPESNSPACASDSVHSLGTSNFLTLSNSIPSSFSFLFVPINTCTVPFNFDWNFQPF